MQRRLTREDDPADWFWMAEERLQLADKIWMTEGLTLGGVEFLQESAERYLKGYLIFQGWTLERTHDLRRLVVTASGFEPAFRKYEDMADMLTEQFFLQHYPGGDLTDFGIHYETMRLQLGEMVAQIGALLPQHFPGK